MTMRHTCTSQINKKIEFNAFNIQNINKKKFLHIMQASLSKWFCAILLQTLLLCYIINIYDGTRTTCTPEKTFYAKAYICSKNIIEISKIRGTGIRSRILSDAENEVEHEEARRTPPLLRKPKQHWQTGLSDDIIKICNKYISLVQIIKHTVFHNPDEFFVIFKKLTKKTDTVRQHAAILLVDESRLHRKAKILRLYTDSLNENSRICRIQSVLNSYLIALKYFMDAHKESNKEDKSDAIMKKLNHHMSLIQKSEPDMAFIIDGRLQSFYDQINTLTDSKYMEKLQKEKQSIMHALFVCDAYVLLLQTLITYGEPVDPADLLQFYHMERVIANQMGQFYMRITHSIPQRRNALYLSE